MLCHFSRAFQICIYCPDNCDDFAIIFRRFAWNIYVLISIVTAIKLLLMYTEDEN